MTKPSTTTQTRELEPQMDWGQVALNGGPPCFYVEGAQYCGRAERWEGHGNPAFHDFVPLEYVTAKPMCPVHRAIEDRGDMELEIGNDCVACSLNERAELLTILAEATAADGRLDSVTALRNLVSTTEQVIRLREAIETEAARRAYAAGLGVSEWEAFLWPEARAALQPKAETEGE